MGSSLGPYLILERLGQGGTGAVYKARDTRLDRTVALKVLLPDAASDEVQRARFEREARAISRLGHPHICALFDVGCHAGTDYLVFEFLEGETLAQRLERRGSRTPAGGTPTFPATPPPADGQRGLERAGRPLTLQETLRIGAELAEALAAAHRAGIVHRDLKPGNVMLTATGTKVLDFGIARMQAAAPAGAGESSVSTCAVEPLTDAGTRLGTIPYMSPEQVEGKEADARSDLFALGAILYEMATGRRPFHGDTAAGVCAAILEREPEPLTALQPLAPPALEHVVSTCLAKDPEARWQSAADVARELRWIAAAAGPTATRTALAAPGSSAPEISEPRTGASATSAPEINAREPEPGARAPGESRLGAWPRSASRIAAAAGAAIVLAGALVAGGFFLASRLGQGRGVEQPLLRLSMTGPPGGTIATDMGSMAVSPDGRRIVFTMVDASGVQRLWVRPLDTPSARPIPGTENAFHPFWSPDSRFVAFFAGGRLWRVEASGGSPEVICLAPSGRGGSWSPEGVIVFAPRSMGPLVRVPAGGGEAVEVVRADPGSRHSGLRYPHFLPDGRHFLFLGLPGTGEEFDVLAGALDGEPPRRIMSAGSAPVYVRSGHLLFTRGGRLVAQGFDAGRLELRGDVVQLADATAATYYDGSPRVSASDGGILVDGGVPPRMRLVWLDRAGRMLEAVPIAPDSYSSPYLSPDGRRAVVAKWTSAGSADLWVVDLERGTASRLTADGQAAGVASWGSDVNLTWSPDGSRIAYVCGVYDLCQMTTTGAGQPERLTRSAGRFDYPSGWSPDGRWLVFSRLEDGTQYDLWLLPSGAPREPVPYLRTPFDENLAAISPDGRWLAYDSDESGTPEIYVTSFPRPGAKHRVSTRGGYRAQWSPDGRQLFIWSSAGMLGTTLGPVYVVDVRTTPAFEAGTPRKLFTPPRNIFGLSATRDLQRFLTTVPVEGWTPTIEVTLNWQSALK